MKKKITILMAVAAMFAGSGGVAYGQQTIGWDGNVHSGDGHTTTTWSIGQYSFDADNNFGAGESGTITPLASGTAHSFGAIYNTWSPYAGLWSPTNNGTPQRPAQTLDMFNAGNGRITIGNVNNTVVTRNNPATGISQTNTHIETNSLCVSTKDAILTINAAPKPWVPDGSGVVGGTSASYSTTTTINVQATTTTSAQPWWLQQIMFYDVPWNYNLYTFTKDNSYASPTYPGHAGSGCGPRTCGVYGDECCGCTWSTTHKSVDVVQSNAQGGYVPGTVNIIAGSHIRLDAGTSIGAGAHTNSTATLNFPTSGNPYSVMMDGMFREDQIATNGSVTGINTMTTNSLIGIQNGYYPATQIVTNALGGTILVGNNILGQDKMVITTPTTASASTGGFTTGSVGSYVYTGTNIGVNGTGNFGNYGNNAVTVAYAPTLLGGGTVGAAAMQVYNHSCNALNFTNQVLTQTIGGTGYFLIEGYEKVNFNVVQTLTASAAGRTIINGGEVNINAAHKFTGSGTPTAGSRGGVGLAIPAEAAYYSINAYNTNPGRVRTHFGTWGTNSSFWDGTSQTCGTGTINLNGVPADVSESADGNLLWNANTDINTIKTLSTPAPNTAVHFTMTGANGSMRWFAGRNIKTDDGVYFSNTGTAAGHTEWNAVWNITDNDTVKFVHSNTSSLTNYLEVKADSGNITANNWYDVEMSNPSRASILAENTTGANSLFFPSNTSHRIVVPYSQPYPVYGNIFFRDSLKLQRLATSGNASMTEIVAGNNIITAMVNYKSNNATNGDNTNIISHMGDIFLGYNITPTGTGSPASNPPVSYDNNRFVYNIPNAVPNGRLYIHAGGRDSVNLGWTGAEDAAAKQTNGGNIYFTHFCDTLAKNSKYDTEVSIAGTNWYRCGSTWSSPLLHNRAGAGMWNYENSGIIGGVARCAMDSSPVVCDTLGLLYSGSKGNLRFDAGTRGNIIINNGAKVTFKDGTGNAIFRTRNGDIDMRYPFDVDSMQGGMLFLAQVNNLGDLQNPNYMSYCGCNEETNNVYLQDFQYTAGENSGSVYVGADNNIKLNYGGLQNVGTKYDPFLSTDYTVDSEGNPLKIGAGYPCGDDYHCDTHDSVNLARDLILNFYQDTTGMDIKKGGFAAVASDYIDVYKNMIYTGGKGSGMAAAPETGTLHGEGVAGYGLYMKTQGNKSNWNVNAFNKIPTCPTGCGNDDCNGAFLHMVSRMTFHADARLYAMKQRVYLGSPVIEVFGDLVLDTDSLDKTGSIVLQTDSLIMHDSLIVVGKGLKYRSWSGLKNDRPIFKFGYNRETPPQNEWKLTGPNAILCEPCHEYIRFSDDPLHMLDTIVIKFQDDAFLERMNSTVFDHTVLTFLTDSFDHKLGNPVQNAKIYVDTLKIRNQVDLYADPDHTRDAHLELISEEQMHSKDYAGAYTRHLHMEPIGPCGKNYSELWTSDDLALDVITTSTFGGFGFIHSDVHVENDGDLNPGFTSLRLHGNCYEQRCGTQRMKDLRLDKGANIHISVGSTIGINNELSDIIDVDRITTYGTVDLHIEKRPCEHFDEGCYPIIYYKSQSDESINNLKITFDLPDKNSAEYKAYREDYERLQKAVLAFEDGVVYLCAGEEVYPTLNRAIQIPSVTGVTTNPPAGISYVISHSNFDFTAAYSTEKPLKVTTNRIFDGVQEELKGTKNANGEYEYTIRQVTQNIVLSIGPDFVANASIDGTAVWSHGEMIYIKVEREDIASIYSVAGQLIKRIDLPEGDTSIPMERGVYVVTLKDGSVHKVIVK